MTMQLQDLTEQSCDLLDSVLAGVEKPDESENVYSAFRHTFILSHAKNVLNTAEDVLDLEDKKRASSAPLLVRGMLESLFILGAATRNDNFVGQKIVYDLEKTAEYERVAIKKTSSENLKKYLQEQADSHSEMAKDLRQRHQITEKLKWAPIDCAVEAGLFRIYAIEYADYSQSTHAEFFNMFFFKDKKTAQVYRTVAFVSLKAVEFLLSSVKSNNHVDFAAQLRRLLVDLKEMEKTGKLRELVIDELEGHQPIVRGKRKSRLQNN